MELHLIEGDKCVRTRIKVGIKELKNNPVLASILKETQPYKQNSRYKYYEFSGDLLNRKKGRKGMMEYFNKNVKEEFKDIFEVHKNVTSYQDDYLFLFMSGTIEKLEQQFGTEKVEAYRKHIIDLMRRKE